MEKHDSQSIHILELQDRCRFCGCKDLQKPTNDDKHYYISEFQEIYQINLSEDKTNIHPNKLCRSHELLFERYKKCKREKTAFKTQKMPSTFSRHDDSNCDICNEIYSFGRPKKKQKIQSKQSDIAIDFGENNRENITVANLIRDFTAAKPAVRQKFLESVLNQNVLTNSELNQLAYNIAKSQSKKVYQDAQTIANFYTDIGNLHNFNINSWLDNRNSVLVNFILGILRSGKNFTDLSSSEVYSIGVCLEIMYKLRSPLTVFPLSFMKTLYVYSATSSRLATDVVGSTLPGGMYVTVISWLKKLASDPLSYPNSDLMNMFDNEQIIGYKSGVKFKNKNKSSIITVKAFVELENTMLQSEENLKPKLISNMAQLKWMSQTDQDFQSNSHRLTSIINQISSQNSEYYNKLEQIHVEQFNITLQNALTDVLSEQSLENQTLNDAIDVQAKKNMYELEKVKCVDCGSDYPKRTRICKVCKSNSGILKFKKEQTSKGETSKEHLVFLDSDEPNYRDEQYKHIPSNHQSAKEAILTDPVFCNPNSLENVAIVLREIGRENGIFRYGGTKRHWTLVCVDGLPHTLIMKLILEAVICTNINCQKGFLTLESFLSHHKECHPEKSYAFIYEFDWLYLRIGCGHYEHNLIKAFIKLNWTPAIECLCENFGFTSDSAKKFAQNGGDHHISWQLLNIFHESCVKELVLPYVRNCLLNSQAVSVDGFYSFYKNKMHTNPNMAYIFNMVSRYSQGIINFRMAIRRNNSDMLESAKYHCKELFFGRNHPNYQQIELFDTIQQYQFPNEVRKMINDYTSITVTGSSTRGEDFDYILEGKNRNLKHYVPKGIIPSDQLWTNLCRNEKPLESIRQQTRQILGLQSNLSNIKSVNLKEQVFIFRTTIRSQNYFTKNQDIHTSISTSPQVLHKSLIEFTIKATENRLLCIKRDILKEEKYSDLDFSPVFITEAEEKDYSLRTIAQIKSSIDKLLSDITDKSIVEMMEHRLLKMKTKPQLTSFYYEIEDLTNSISACDEDEIK